jgi:hypothetical protein
MDPYVAIRDATPGRTEEPLDIASRATPTTTATATSTPGRRPAAPNDYLSLMIEHHVPAPAPAWVPARTGNAKTVVTTQTDLSASPRASARPSSIAPVGIKVVRDWGLLKGQPRFAGEESAGASFLRRDGRRLEHRQRTASPPRCGRPRSPRTQGRRPRRRLTTSWPGVSGRHGRAGPHLGGRDGGHRSASSATLFTRKQIPLDRAGRRTLVVAGAEPGVRATARRSVGIKVGHRDSGWFAAWGGRRAPRTTTRSTTESLLDDLRRNLQRLSRTRHSGVVGRGRWPP